MLDLIGLFPLYLIGMILATSMSMITESVYGELTKKRDGLVALQEKAFLPKHKKMIREQLTEIRQTLKDAHHEQYKQTNQH